MKRSNLILIFFFLGTISFAQTKDVKPDSTVYKYLMGEYQKQVEFNKKYEDVPVVKEYISQMQQTQKLITMIQEEMKKLQSEKSKDAKKEGK